MQAFRTKTAAGIDLLPPERASRAAPAAARSVDYIDVEFETLTSGERRSPYPVFNDNRRSAGRPVSRLTAVEGEGLPRRIMAMIEARLDAMPARRFAGLVAGLGLAAFLSVAGLGGQGEADAHPLAIEGVTTALGDSGGMRVLSVYGTIDNRSEGEQRLPSVVVEVTSNGRKVTATRLMAEGGSMAPGERRHFVARLPYAGGKKPDVTVSFAENSASLR
ncbi:MAG TPA: hypothetical protein VD840_18595 [Sinorhizobium sp.]|nr:hypothetical protein [Sinorhizobium sp.]